MKKSSKILKKPLDKEKWMCYNTDRFKTFELLDNESEVMIMKRIKRKTVWAYLDGKKLVDVVKAALDNNMMVDDMKKLLIEENPGHQVTFKCE